MKAVGPAASSRVVAPNRYTRRRKSCHTDERAAGALLHSLEYALQTVLTRPIASGVGTKHYDVTSK